MTNLKSSSVVNVIQGLADFYSEIKLANKESGQYKIANIIEGELDEEPKIIVQVRNKNISYSLNVMDVVANDNILHQFSRGDIKQIVYIACEYKNRPKVKISKLSFSGKLKKIVFSFAGGVRENKVKDKTASELMNSDEVISSMSSQDALKVGYTAGSETSQEQQAEIDRLSESNVK
jgi:hypothetical protein